MAKPKILEIREKLEWKAKDVDLSYDAKIIIQDLKDANEVIVCFGISETSFVTMVYPKALSGKWVSTMAKNDTSTEVRGSARINFETGEVLNGTKGYIDLAIKKIVWR